MFNDAAAILDGSNGPIPAKIIIDELQPGTWQTVRGFAESMRFHRPQYNNGRWAVYAAHPNNGPGGTLWGYSTPGIVDAFNEIFLGGGIIACEMYPAQSAYCANSRDSWLQDYYRGNAGVSPRDGFHWLNLHKAAWFGSSLSQLTVVFGVGNLYMNGPSYYKFLDRMFYVWRRYSGYPSVIDAERGGAGSYKWEGPNYITVTNRDQYYGQSWNRYCAVKSTSPLYTVDC
jgi:hypothetical protein